MSAAGGSHKLKLSIADQLYEDAQAAMAASDIDMFTGWIRAAMVEKICRDHPRSQTAMIEAAKAEYNARVKRADAARQRRERAAKGKA